MGTKTKQTEENLTAFQWDEASDESTFFGVPTPEDSTIEKVKKDVEEDQKQIEEEEEEKKKVKEEEEDEEEVAEEGIDDDDEFFGQQTSAKKKVESKEDEEKEGEGEEDVEFFTTLSTELKTKGIFQHIELQEDEQITEDKFFELQEQEVEARVKEDIQIFMESLDEEGQAYIKFKQAGGKNSDFFKVFAETSKIPQVDIETEEGQNEVLRYYYKHYEELDEADIADKLEWLEETGKRDKYAKKYNAKLLKDKETAEADIIKKQENAQKALEKSRDTFINSVKETANQMDEFNGFKFTKQDKTELVDYILKPSVKLENGRYLTGLQHAINTLYGEDKQKLLLLAKLLKSDFDFSTFIKQATTKVTKETKSKLAKTKNTLAGSSVPTRKSSLADLF